MSDGRAVCGVLHVTRRDSSQAHVRRGWRVEHGAARDVCVCGVPALNRALHGDTVVLRLLPREQWVVRSRRGGGGAAGAGGTGDGDLEAGGALQAAEGPEEVVVDEDDEDDGLTDVVESCPEPCGEVVAVVRRPQVRTRGRCCEVLTQTLA